MPSEQPVPHFFLLLIAAAALLLGAVLLPLASELLLAAVLAGVLWPLQQWFTERLRGRRGVAAGLLTTAVVMLLIGPLATLVAFVIRDGQDGIHFVLETLRSERVAELVAILPASARDFVTDAIARLPTTLDEAVEQIGAQSDIAAAAVGRAVTTTGSLLFHAVMMLIALFFFLVRGQEIVDWLDSAAPLRRGQTRELLAGFKRVSFAVIVSSIITAAVQAIAALVGYYIARVPSPVFFGAVTFFVALIPAIGAASVCLVAALLLLATGHPYMAIFLAAWGILVVGLVDNLVRPLLVRRGMEMHLGVVFFSLIGGLAAFGAIGLLIGPFAISLFLTLVRMYHRDFSPQDRRVPPVPELPPPE